MRNALQRLSRRQVLMATIGPLVVCLGLFWLYASVGRPIITTTTRATPTSGVLITAYLPPSSIFGLTRGKGIVTLPHPYGANVLGGNTANASTLYLLQPKSHGAVRLPGRATDHYTFTGSICIYGSGCVETWSIDAGGGRFAILHLAHMRVADTSVRIRPPPATPGPYLGYDQTSQDTNGFIAPPSASERSAYTGGTVIGHVGHPTLPQFSNGVSPLKYSELLVVTDDRASQYFFAIYNQIRAKSTPQPTVTPARHVKHHKKHHHRARHLGRHHKKKKR